MVVVGGLGRARLLQVQISTAAADENGDSGSDPEDCAGTTPRAPLTPLTRRWPGRLNWPGLTRLNWPGWSAESVIRAPPSIRFARIFSGESGRSRPRCRCCKLFLRGRPGR